MPQDLAVLAEDTPVHAARMERNAAIRVVLLGGESPEVTSSSIERRSPTTRIPLRYAEVVDDICHLG
jgi:hypothetical protein